MKVLAMCLLLTACAVPPSPPPSVLAFIGLGACGKWMGGIVVTSDGQVHPSNEITEDQALALIKPLPKGTSTMAMAPCVKEDPTAT